MSGSQSMSETVKLTEEQEKEGYWVEQSGEYMLVWHRNNQIALLLSTADIGQKVQNTIERKRKELKEVEEKTGWKPD